ncbi:MAG: hypothetical protein MJ171_07245 [Clostridia bacterium]|nr:hypothetical protein [Clostridia bacterium]
MGDIFSGKKKKKEVFDYKMVQDYYNSGEFYINYVKDGKDMGDSQLSFDISELLERNDLWGTEQCSIAIDFKNGTDRVFLESLRNITREFLDEYDLPCCESLWEDEEEEALEEGDGKTNWLICPNAIFSSLPDTKAYLDKLNAALEAFTGQFECSCYDSGNNEDCCLLIDFKNFGVAKIFWTEETGFAICGAYL